MRVFVQVRHQQQKQPLQSQNSSSTAVATSTAIPAQPSPTSTSNSASPLKAIPTIRNKVEQNSDEHNCVEKSEPVVPPSTSFALSEVESSTSAVVVSTDFKLAKRKLSIESPIPPKVSIAISRSATSSSNKLLSLVESRGLDPLLGRHRTRGEPTKKSTNHLLQTNTELPSEKVSNCTVDKLESCTVPKNLTVNDINTDSNTGNLSENIVYAKTNKAVKLDPETTPINKNSSSSAIHTTSNNITSHKSLERKRKASGSIDILDAESKPSPNKKSSSASITSSPSKNLNQQEPPKDKRKEIMVQHLRSQTADEGLDHYSSNDVRTNSSSRPSSSSRAYHYEPHRQLVCTSTTEEEDDDRSTVTNTAIVAEHENNPVYENTPHDAVSEHHNYDFHQVDRRPRAASSASSEREEFHTRGGDVWDVETEQSRGDVSNSSVYSSKLPASITATNGLVVEEEEGRKSDEYETFQVVLKKRGLEMVEQEGDGNCLFRAVSLQVYGAADVHMDVRKRCLDFMAKDEAHFSEFVVDEPFMQYIRRKRQSGVHGNNPEIQAISELYNRPVEVFVPKHGATPINIFHADYKTCDVPIRLSYHDGNHYNAVIDPLCPTAGLGLGLPGLEPGLADRMQMQKAVDESEDLHVEKVAKESHEMEVQKAIVESKRESNSKGFDMYYKQKAALMMSDLEATDFELEQAALVDSLDSHNIKEAGRKQPWNHNGQQQQQKQHHSRERRRQHSHHDGSSSSAAFSTGFAETSSSTTVTRTRAHSATSSSLVASLPPIQPSETSKREHDEHIPAHLLSTNHGGDDDEYPQTVQELVMNGFSLERVLKAYDLIGDNFNDLLAFLMNSGSVG